MVIVHCLQHYVSFWIAYFVVIFRKCQLITTGPWREVPNLALIDMSLQVDVEPNFDGPIALWAVGANGDVVTRMGVTTEIPQVS